MQNIFKSLAVVALVGVSATGAFAQGRGGLNSHIHGDTVYETQLSNFPHIRSARDAYAAEHPAHMRNNDVYAPNGEYLGSDPDPNVQLELRRDQCRWGC